MPVKLQVCGDNHHHGSDWQPASSGSPGTEDHQPKDRDRDGKFHQGQTGRTKGVHSPCQHQLRDVLMIHPGSTFGRVGPCCRTRQSAVAQDFSTILHVPPQVRIGNIGRHCGKADEKNGRNNQESSEPVKSVLC